MTPRTRNEPNERTQRTAARLLAIAPLITQLVQHHREELSSLGFPGSSGEPRDRGGGAALTPTERDAIRCAQLTAQREDLRDLINTIESHSHALVRVVHFQLGIPLPGADGEALCCDKQRGRDGALEWGDPLCKDLPVRHGLCERCLKRETRWRREHNLPFRGEEAA